MAGESFLKRLSGGIVVSLLLAGGLLAPGASSVGAQDSAVLRLASLPQWVTDQHPVAGALRAAVDGGVVDRVVLWWQRGVIQRDMLVGKPVRVLSQAEAEPLGGRGEFQGGALLWPSAQGAWARFTVRSATARPDDIVVIEVGGEINTLRQVLSRLFVAGGSAGLDELPLVRRALIEAPGVPVITWPFGRPVTGPEAGRWFAGPGGLEFLVVRSPGAVIENGATTTNGRADRSISTVDDWREGDRVLVRVAWQALRAGVPGVVLAWKDRTPKGDPDGADPFRLGRLGFVGRP
jgi:hypothetical protein